MAVRQIDFGFPSARAFWDEVAMPAYQRFKREPNRAHAMAAALPAWHVIDWLLVEQNPKPKIEDFRTTLFRRCAELEWIGDIANGAKHRELNRGQSVARVGGTGIRSEGQETDALGTRTVTSYDPLMLTLDDGTQHNFDDVLDTIIAYWRREWFK